MRAIGRDEMASIVFKWMDAVGAVRLERWLADTARGRAKKVSLLLSALAAIVVDF